MLYKQYVRLVDVFSSRRMRTYELSIQHCWILNLAQCYTFCKRLIYTEIWLNSVCSLRLSFSLSIQIVGWFVRFPWNSRVCVLVCYAEITNNMQLIITGEQANTLDFNLVIKVLQKKKPNLSHVIQLCNVHSECLFGVCHIRSLTVHTECKTNAQN